MEIKLLKNVNVNTVPVTIWSSLGDILNDFEHGGWNCGRSREAVKNLQFYLDLGLLDYYSSELDRYEPIDVEQEDAFWNAYYNGFGKGYEEFDDALESTPFSSISDETKVSRVFSSAYKKYDDLKEFPLNHDEDGTATFDYDMIFEYGQKMGATIRAWDIILNNQNLFEPLFDKKPPTADVSVRKTFEWTRSQIDMLELSKALFESGAVKGGTQEEFITSFSGMFAMIIKHPNKYIGDLNKRNGGSETPFLDKLKSSLLNYFSK